MRLSAKSGHQRRLACEVCLQRVDIKAACACKICLQRADIKVACLWVLSVKSGHQSGLPVRFVCKERTSKRLACEVVCKERTPVLLFADGIE